MCWLEAGHLADGVLKPQHLLLAHVTREHARVIAIAARVRDALAEFPQALSQATMYWDAA